MSERPPAFSDRVYAWLLSLFPRDFRGEFGDQMADDFRDQRRETTGRVAAAGLWVRTTAGVVRQAPREHLELLGRDIAYAMRLVRRSPGFTTVAVLTLALGIGTHTAIFSLADGMLLRPLPFRDPERLVLIQGLSRTSGETYTRVSRIDFEQIRANHRGIADVAIAENRAAFTWLGTDGAETISTSEASPDLLDLLGVSPHIGRALRPGDDVTVPRPAMLTYDAWHRRFGADPTVVGRTLTFDEGLVQIVGILPQRFIYPLQGSLVSGQLLLAATPNPKDAANPRAGVWSPVARLKPGVSITQAQSEMDVLVRQAAQQFPETPQDRALRITNLQYALFELSRPILWLLVGAAGFVLLIACVNLATLLTARGTAREQEIGIRMAIGASRGRIVRQLMIESLVLGILGGALALLIAGLTFHTLAQQVPARYRLVPEGLNARALMFTSFISVAAGLLFGTLPAARLSNPDLNSAIRENRRARRPIGGLMRAGAPLVAAEVALAMILLAGTGLMVNSLVRMRTVDLGFEPGRAMVLNVSLPRFQYSTPARYEYFQQLLDRVRRLPGVQAAGAVEYLQVGDMASPAGLRHGGPPGTGIWRVTPGYVHAMGIPLLDGRDFGAEDIRNNTAVAIVSESVARHLWPDGSAVGRQLQLDDKSQLTIIGIVGDVRSGYGRPIRPSVYRPITRQQFGPTIVARTAGDPAALAVAMRTEAQRLEPRAIVPLPGSVATMLGRGIAGFRFETSLFVLFGVLGLIVAAIGVYGLMAFWVGARTREMGVRIALGANARHLKSLVARQSATPLVAGLVCGMIGAFVLARRLESLLYGITPHDVPTLTAVAAVLLAVGMAAAYVPARRAARVDPMIALRSE